MPTAAVQARPGQLVGSVAALTVLATAYLGALLVLTRASVWVEVAVVSLPLVAWAFGGLRHPQERLGQLVVIESVFVVTAAVARLGHVFGIAALDRITGVAFVAFMVLQVSGFAVRQVQLRRPLGLLQTLLGGILLSAWCTTAPTLDSVGDGAAVYMWGAEAPLAVRLYYVPWVLNALMVDTKTFPWVRQVVVHVVSIGFALALGPFFHVRLYTACHLFTLDWMLGYTNRAGHLGDGFAVLPPHLARWWERSGRWWMARATTAACVGIAVAAWVWGLDLGA